MQAREQKIGDLLVVFLQGRLDRAAAPALQQQLLARIHAGQNSLLVDCTDLNLLSSRGLAAIWAAYKALRQRNGWMALCCLLPPPLDLLRMTGMLRYLPLFPSREEAIRAFTASHKSAQGESQNGCDGEVLRGVLMDIADKAVPVEPGLIFPGAIGRVGPHG